MMGRPASRGPGAVAAARGAGVVGFGGATGTPFAQNGSGEKRPPAPAPADGGAPAPGEAGEVLFEFAKRGGTTFRVAVRAFRGTRFLDVREWVPDGTGHKATRKGATMPLERMGALGAALVAHAASDAPGRPPREN